MTNYMGKIFQQYETIVAYDCSGSTSSSYSDTTFYHLKTQTIVKDLDPLNTLFLRWDHDLNVISKEDLEEINIKKKGFGGTSPIKLYEYIKNIKFKGNLIFISDGQIDEAYVQNCSDTLKDWKFNMINIYLIYTGGPVNESVSCTLTRDSPHEINIYKKDCYNEPTIISVTKEDFKFVYNIETINTIEEFQYQVETIKNVLFSVNSGTGGNKILHDKLVALKNRLIKFESKSFTGKTNNPVSKLIDSFEEQNPSLNYLEGVWKMYFKDEVDDDDWKKTIDKFISWCAGGLSSIFDRNKVPNREINKLITPIPNIENVEILEEKVEDFKISCPINLTDSTNIIILMKKTSVNVFLNLSTEERDSLINCPLNALNNKDILNYIKSLFDCAISIEAYKELVEHGISDKSPLTRKEIFGGLCLGKDKSHVAATNSTLRYILTGGKSLGNIDLWFANIYFLIKRGYIEHLKEYLPIFEEHMKFRLLNSKSYMCLSGLPTYPTYSVPLGLAMWCSIMVTTSTLSLIKNPKNDPLRMHLSYSLEIIEILNILNIIVPDNIFEHINRLKILRIFLKEIKRGKNESFKLTNLIDALFYNAIEAIGLWILIDGVPSKDQIDNVKSQLPTICQNFSNVDIMYIFKLCNSNKTESDIYLPYNYISSKNKFINTQNWNFTNDIPCISVPVCPHTCRPYYTITDKGIEKVWSTKALEIYGVNLFSTNNFFGSYVFQNKKYPSKSNFLIYLFKYYYTRDKKTLPICIDQFVDEVYDDYENIMIKISPSDFADRWEKSNHINVRRQMELN